jgi:chemotaxis protein MotD
MTRAGSVAEQPAMPSKTTVARLSDAGAQKNAGARKDATAPSDDLEKEFAELLSKLNGANGQDVDRPALADGSVKKTALRHAQQHRIAARFTEDEESGDAGKGAGVDGLPSDDADAGKDPASQAGADTLKASGLSASALGFGQIAAIVTPTQPQSSTEGTPDAAARSPRPNRGPGAAIPGRAILDASAGSDDAKVPPAQGTTVKGQAARDGGQQAPTTPVDLSPTRTRAPEAAIVKDQLAQDNEGWPLPGAKEAVLASASDAVAEGRVPPARADVPKVSVVKRETHFAPVLRQAMSAQFGGAGASGGRHGARANANGAEAGASSAPSIDAASLSGEGTASMVVAPAQQIADRIAAEVPAFEAADRAGAAPDQPGARPVLKIVQIQLQPADLGTVTVRIELKAANLKLHVETDRPETADIIRGDQDTLSKLLRSAGYGVDSGAIRVTEGDRSVASAQAGQQGAQTNLQSSTQSHPGWSDRQESAQRDHRGAQGGSTQAQVQADRSETHGTTTNRTGRDLYV